MHHVGRSALASVHEQCVQEFDRAVEAFVADAEVDEPALVAFTCAVIKLELQEQLAAARLDCQSTLASQVRDGDNERTCGFVDWCTGQAVDDVVRFSSECIGFDRPLNERFERLDCRGIVVKPRHEHGNLTSAIVTCDPHRAQPLPQCHHDSAIDVGTREQGSRRLLDAVNRIGLHSEVKRTLGDLQMCGQRPVLDEWLHCLPRTSDVADTLQQIEALEQPVDPGVAACGFDKCASSSMRRERSSGIEPALHVNDVFVSGRQQRQQAPPLVVANDKLDRIAQECRGDRPRCGFVVLQDAREPNRIARRNCCTLPGINVDGGARRKRVRPGVGGLVVTQEPTQQHRQPNMQRSACGRFNEGKQIAALDNFGFGVVCISGAGRAQLTRSAIGLTDEHVEGRARTPTPGESPSDTSQPVDHVGAVASVRRRNLACDGANKARVVCVGDDDVGHFNVGSLRDQCGGERLCSRVGVGRLKQQARRLPPQRQ
jgi:hypothetical protein